MRKCFSAIDPGKTPISQHIHTGWFESCWVLYGFAYDWKCLPLLIKGWASEQDDMTEVTSSRDVVHISHWISIDYKKRQPREKFELLKMSPQKWESGNLDIDLSSVKMTWSQDSCAIVGIICTASGSDITFHYYKRGKYASDLAVEN